MKEIVFNNLFESIFKAELSNGMKVYFYPTGKSKNFYISINVKYGSNIVRYKKGNQKKYSEIIPGSAHFLEHKVMDLNAHKKEFEIVNNLGSFSNAYTTYNGTNYNIFGSEDILTNMKILLDLVFMPNITEKNVEAEKGIIEEEIDIYKDDINTYIMNKMFQNIFKKSFAKNSVLGEKSDIRKITAKGLNKIYKDFYNVHNMFIVVTGNFDKSEVLKFLNDYMSNLRRYPKYDIKIKNEREPEEVNISYEEIQKDFEGSIVLYGAKVKQKTFKNINKIKRNYYLIILLSSMFSTTSQIYEKYKNENLINSLIYSVINIDKYTLFLIDALTNNPSEFIDNLQKDIKLIDIDEDTFNRKKKVYLSELIMIFENIEDVENLIAKQIFGENKIINNIYDLINELSYREIKEVEKKLKFDIYSVIRTIK